MEEEILHHILTGTAGGGAIYTVFLFQRLFKNLQEVLHRMQDMSIQLAEMRTELKTIKELELSHKKMQEGVHHIEKDVLHLKVRFDHLENGRAVAR